MRKKERAIPYLSDSSYSLEPQRRENMDIGETLTKSNRAGQMVNKKERL